MITTVWSWQAGQMQVSRWGQKLVDPAMDTLVDRLIADLDEDVKLGTAALLWHRHLGRWQAAWGAYAPGDLVNHGGEIWVAMSETAERPGEGSGWRNATRLLEGRAAV